MFWYEPEQRFADELTQLNLPNTQILNMQGKSTSTFDLKLRLELEDT